MRGATSELPASATALYMCSTDVLDVYWFLAAVLCSLLFLAKVQLDAALVTAIASPFYLAKLICELTPGLWSG